LFTSSVIVKVTTANTTVIFITVEVSRGAECIHPDSSLWITAKSFLHFNRPVLLSTFLSALSFSQFFPEGCWCQQETDAELLRNWGEQRPSNKWRRLECNGGDWDNLLRVVDLLLILLRRITWLLLGRVLSSTPCTKNRLTRPIWIIRSAETVWRILPYGFL
jgi:hypothetical protein